MTMHPAPRITLKRVIKPLFPFVSFDNYFSSCIHTYAYNVFIITQTDSYHTRVNNKDVKPMGSSE